jgi:hypothetical protein
MAGREHRISIYIITFSHYLVKRLDRNITLFKHGGTQLRSNEVDKIRFTAFVGNDVRRLALRSRDP